MSEPVKIDCHMHIYPSKRVGRQQKENYQIWEYGLHQGAQFSKYDGDLNDALQAINESGFQHAVVVNLFSVENAVSTTLAQYPSNLTESDTVRMVKETKTKVCERLCDSNIAVCEMAKKHRQLVPFIGLDPNAGLDPEEMASHLQVMVKNHGARGVKLHPISQQFFPSDIRMRPTYRACSDLGVPILSHSGLAQTTQFAEPGAYSKVLDEFPNLKLILAHLGGAAWRQSIAFSKRYPNVYFDCSEIIEWTGAPNAPSMRELGELIVEIGADRVMLGTDFPWYDLNHTAELVLKLPMLSEEQKRLILGTNALQILRL